MEYDIYPFHNPLVFSTWVLLGALYFSFKITTVGTLMERTRLCLMNTSSKRVDYNSNWVCGKARFWPSFYRIFLALFFENKSTLKESQHGWCYKGPLEDILSNSPVQAGQPCPGPCPGGFWESPSTETSQPLWTTSSEFPQFWMTPKRILYAQCLQEWDVRTHISKA